MGNCASGNTKSYQQNTAKSENIAYSKLSEHEIKSLSLIYRDLAQRDQNDKLNIENFQLFFHKNGFWGQRLFKQFDSDQSGYISEKDFIKGIVRIFKTTELQKIKLLYHFFQKEDQQGISFNDFVIVLYNYPKADLKEIFNDEQFFDTQIKKNLIEIRKGNSPAEEVKNDLSQKTHYRIEGSQNLSDAPIPSAYGFKGILQDLKKKRDQQDKTSMNIKVDGRYIEVKTTNIQHLVKKFARKLFTEYNIDEKTGRLSFDNFCKWIQGHQNLYKNYYDGFHNEVWQDDPNSHRPKFLDTKNQKESTGKMDVNNISSTVKLHLLNSTIIISTEGQIKEPLFIICLDGLAVKKIFDKSQGFGIEISHHDGIYQIKTIFMKNEDLINQWMELLKFYKGSSAQQHYQMGQKVGTGKFSIVYACRQKKTNKQYAMKVIESAKLDAEARSLIAHESSIMSVLNHPLLVSFKQNIQTKTHLYIITGLVKGKDLFEYIKQNGVMSEIEAAKVIRQLILGVKHLHDIGIVHRDLKPQNVMISTDKNSKESESVKIIDFGFSIYKTSLDQLQANQILAGTPSYIAPEILRSQQITERIDNFAIGAIIYFVLSASVPFNGRNIHEMFQKTLDGNYTYDQKIWRSLSLEAKDLIDKLLLGDSKNRISLEEALKHEWFIKTNKK